MIMNKLQLKIYSFIFLFLLVSKPVLSAEGIEYKHFLGIALDEKFWVLIAFILFLLLIGKKATNAANSALDNRSNIIKDKINNAEEALTEAKELLKETKKALSDHKNKSDDLINKQKDLAEKNAVIYANKIQDEIKRKNISADREIQYMHTEATVQIKNKIASITLQSVEDLATNELKNSKSDKIYQNFINNIPKALKS